MATVNKIGSISAGIYTNPNTLSRSMSAAYTALGTQINTLADIFSYNQGAPVQDVVDLRWTWNFLAPTSRSGTITSINSGLSGTSVFTYAGDDYQSVNPLFRVVRPGFSAETRPATIYETFLQYKNYVDTAIASEASRLATLVSSFNYNLVGVDDGSLLVANQSAIAGSLWRTSYEAGIYTLNAPLGYAKFRGAATYLELAGPKIRIQNYLSLRGIDQENVGEHVPEADTGRGNLYYSSTDKKVHIIDEDGLDTALEGSSQPYLELTNNPFIIKPLVLGTPVTVSTAGDGSGAEVEVVIGAGPVITSITVTTPGTGYIVGQRYRISAGQIGASLYIADSIDFEVATVSSGGLSTVTGADFIGEATNAPGTYSGVTLEYRASPGDVIDDGVTLARGPQGALFNIEMEAEYDDNNYISPIGTEWNSDGWGDLTTLSTRSYGTLYSVLNNRIGNNIIGAELVMHDMINGKYYKFTFTNWGSDNGGSYAYTRTLITDPNYFSNPDNAESVDIINAGSIGITRDAVAGNLGIYNPFGEAGWVQGTSTVGIVWNTDGWEDLTNVLTRTYDDFYAAYNSNLYSRIPGSRAVMYVPSIQKYYAVQWLSWEQDGAGGGFSYLRYELDLTQLQRGITFADGTILNSAEGLGRVKLTSPGKRRIEEVYGYKSVVVTEIVTTNLETVASRTQTGDYIYIDSTMTTIDDIISTPANYNNAYEFEFSLDNTTWYAVAGGPATDGNERGYSISQSVTYSEGDIVYFRYKTGGNPVVWWDAVDLPGSDTNFRGAVIDYHAWTGESTIIGTIHIVDDDGEEHITHTEVQSGSTDGENDDLWLVQNEGTISYRRIDGESKTLEIQWTAKVFYGSELYD